MKSKIEQSQDDDADDNTLSRKQLINAGYRETKYFWYKRNKYGTVQISKGGVQ